MVLMRRICLRQDSNALAEEAALPELADADLLIWTGDLNYRIEYLSFEEVVNLIAKRQWDDLLANDQLRFEMGYGRTFPGMREGAIRFPPTYKFDKGTTREPSETDLSFSLVSNPLQFGSLVSLIVWCCRWSSLHRFLLRNLWFSGLNDSVLSSRFFRFILKFRRNPLF